MDEILTRSLHAYLASTEDLIEEARNGRMFILVDDEDARERGRPGHPGPVRHARGDQFHGQARARADLPGHDPPARRAAWACR